MAPDEVDRIRRALGSDWLAFRTVVDRWFRSHRNEVHLGLKSSFDDRTLLSFELGAYLYDPAGGVEFKAYPDTPAESFTFASTGVDGEHYSVILSPEAFGVVVLTAPMALDQPRTVIGESLTEALSLACVCGLAAVPSVADLDWERVERLLATDGGSRLWQAIRDELGLSPLRDPRSRLEELAIQYVGRIRPTEPDG